MGCLEETAGHCGGVREEATEAMDKDKGARVLFKDSLAPLSFFPKPSDLQEQPWCSQFVTACNSLSRHTGSQSQLLRPPSLKDIALT